MSGWSGFTDEDLHRLKSDSSSDQVKTHSNAHRSVQLSGRKTRPKEKLVTLSQQRKTAASGSKQSKVAAPLLNMTAECDVQADPAKSEPLENEKKNSKELSKDEMNSPTEKRSESAADLPVMVSDERAAVLEASALELLQQKQKKMESENKKKKLLIKETIQRRYKKAHEETKVLQDVQKELNKLDQKLAGDVEVLRIKIEEASINFHHAEKRYERAENEFVAAKIELHARRETKDDLTHHLYTIIQENEQRKATKLEDIMAKLKLAQNEASEGQACHSNVSAETESVDSELSRSHDSTPAATNDTAAH